jgi:hypothetical protein
VRIAAPGELPRGQLDLRIAGDHRPVTQAGAPFGALLRRFPYGVGPRFRDRLGTFVFGFPFCLSGQTRQPNRSCRAVQSASSWREALVPPGGAPTPPEYEVASLVRGRRPSTRPGIAGRRLPDLGPVLRSRLRPAPPSRRLMRAPLG